MKRREFLISATAGAAVLSFPTPVFAIKDKTPRTVDELIAWFEENFDCRLGEAGPYVSSRDKSASSMYNTYAAGTHAGAGDELRLVKLMYADFNFSPIKGQRLYWRLPAKITLDTYDQMEEVPVEEPLTKYELKYGGMTRKNNFGNVARRNWVLPDGIEPEPEYEYKWVKAATVTQIRTRLKVGWSPTARMTYKAERDAVILV